MKVSMKAVAQMTGHNASVYALTEGRTPGHLLSGGADKMVAEWNLESFDSQPFAIRMESTVYSLCLIPEHQILLIGTAQGGIHVIDLEQKKEIRHLAFHQQGIFHLCWSAARQQFLALSADGSFTVWDGKQFALERHLFLCEAKLRQAAFSADSQQVAIAGGDGKVRIFNANDYSLIQELSGHDRSVNAVAWHPSKPLLLTGGYDAHLRFWASDQGFKLVHSIPAHNFAIYGIDFHPTGDFVATASRDKTVKVWDAHSFEVLQRLDRKAGGHLNSVNSVKWMQNGKQLVSTGDDRSIVVWEFSKL